MWLHVVLITLFFISEESLQASPNLSKTSQEAIIVSPGDDALIDCKVENLQNYSVVWKFVFTNAGGHEQASVLTAGKVRVTNDQRFSVLHKADHNIWILKIENAQATDSGIYVCEVNSNPKQQVARLVSVADAESEASNKTISINDVQHNYTDCCVAEKVPNLCHGFCQLSGLVSGRTPQHVVQSCIEYLPSITKCLADGRNHMPCCERQNIPLACRPVCVGNFTLTTVTDHFTCMKYTAPLLACVAEGIETLPPQPREFTAEPVSSTEILVKWKRPKNNLALIESYQLNVTQLHSFDGLSKKIDNLGVNSNSQPSLYGLQLTYLINASLTEYKVKELKPFTMYEVQMITVNSAGSSLPTDTIRFLTHVDEAEEPEKYIDKPDPTLPNIRKCCEDSGVQSERCMDILCDPTKADTATIADFMLCAPWSNITFKCMATGFDHSSCCRQRGVSPVCLPLCEGNVKKFDFRHFACLEHMSSYTSCILDHHEVLTSEPREFKIFSVHHDWAVIKWRPPKKLAHTVEGYYVHWREAKTRESDDNYYQVEFAEKSPYLIEDLKPGMGYEAFVSAVNKYGVSESSIRIMFSTPPIPTAEEIELEGVNTGYNETACCVRANLPKKCMPLCNYKMKVADVLKLAGTCTDLLPTLVRCGAGGRNHAPCCRRRDVHPACLNVCAGLVESSPFVVATRCANDFGKIIQCMEEGAGLLPGMPLDFHTTLVTKNSIQLRWKPATEDIENFGLITFEVRYGKVNSEVPLHPLDHDKRLNATKPSTVITGLNPGTRYSLYVVAVNMYGISLPSLVLVVTTAELDESEKSEVVRAQIGPPHSLEVIHQTVESVTFKWLPPLYVPSDSSISYVVYYKAINGTASKTDDISAQSWMMVETSHTSMYLTNLTYNTEYAFAVQAKSNKNQTSQLSEVIIVWTNPAIRASVQLPVVIPAGPIMEGSNVTFMCVAMGIPMPTLSLFVNGQLVVKREFRHVAYSIANVNRSLSSVACHAVNGIGQDTQSAQSSLLLRVRSREPTKTTSPSPENNLIKNTNAKTTSSENKLIKNSVTVFLGIGLGMVLVALSAAAVFYYYQRFYKPSKLQTRGVSFENPTYMKDGGTVQIQDHINLSPQKTEQNGNKS